MGESEHRLPRAGGSLHPSLLAPEGDAERRFGWIQDGRDSGGFPPVAQWIGRKKRGRGSSGAHLGWLPPPSLFLAPDVTGKEVPPPFLFTHQFYSDYYFRGFFLFLSPILVGWCLPLSLLGRFSIFFWLCQLKAGPEEWKGRCCSGRPRNRVSFSSSFLTPFFLSPAVLSLILLRSSFRSSFYACFGTFCTVLVEVSLRGR